jgi:hypothetical protein
MTARKIQSNGHHGHECFNARRNIQNKRHHCQDNADTMKTTATTTTTTTTMTTTTTRTAKVKKSIDVGPKAATPEHQEEKLYNHSVIQSIPYTDTIGNIHRHSVPWSTTNLIITYQSGEVVKRRFKKTKSFLCDD